MVRRYSAAAFGNIGVFMSATLNPAIGIELLVEKCREKFRCPENTDFYDEDDYKEAERKYIKFCLNGRLGS
jgi:hypothetical protein